jgi:site-specific recombinase XerD
MENKTTLKSYSQWLQTKGLQSSTLKNYLWHTGQFYKWLAKNKLTEPQLKKYLAYLLKRYKKVGTINLALIILNNHLAWLQKKFRFPLLTNKLSTIKTLNEGQLQEFLDQPLKTPGFIGLRNKALLELLYATGFKVGQIVNLKTKQIDKIEKELLLKNKNIKIKPLAWFHLEKYLALRLDDEEWLFINLDRARKNKNHQLSPRSVERIITGYAKKLAPPLIITPQILRNTLTLQLKKQGAQTEEIRQLLHFQTTSGAKNYLQRI